MIYPANFEQKTGFERIREKLLQLCFSSLGRNETARIQFYTDKKTIEELLTQTEEFRQILLNNVSFPGSNYFDPFDVFDHLKLQETFVEGETLLQLRLSLQTILDIIGLLEKEDDEGKPQRPSLAALIEGVEIEPELQSRIDTIIDEKAEIRSSASAELGRIRKERQQLELHAIKKLHHLLAQGKSQGWIPQETELTLRNGRQVIPVAASYKRKIRGFVHDQSATGQTVFLEPEEVFDLNNQIRELEFEERQEIIRILKAFADYLRPMLPALRRAYDMLGKIDAIRAKARLALEMEAYKPNLHEEPLMNWVNARHPLLFLSYKLQGKHVVPFSIELNRENRILIISGPNAGGKSVCLKACGLIQYMLQCGLLVPMADYSDAGIFEKIFIDIGDEQSLENDLSTYSSHLLNMKYFARHSHDKTLFLIDEFGTGTEPRMGGAIAEAILESLNESKAMGVVTTHYANLKVMAGQHAGMRNASMLFDTRNMKPLFQLKTGNPGSSFAFEIAKTIGLSDTVLQKAEFLAGSQNIDFDRQLQDLEVKKLELEQKEKELRSAENFLSEMIDKYESMHHQLSSRKTDIILEARKEAKSILDTANKIIEKTIREIRENQARQAETREARQALEKFIRDQDRAMDMTAKPLKKTLPQNQLKVVSGPVSVGDTVRIVGQKSLGEVLEVAGNKAIVSFGSMKINAPIQKLEKLDKSVSENQKKGSGVKMAFNINEKAAQFSPNIDVRGLRADEAISKLRPYIDDALLLNAKQVKILHGKGDGILRMVIREFLKDTPEIHRFRDEHPDRGGAGATIVDFRL